MPGNQRFIVGIDEAGRGPCIGPLVITAYVIPTTKIDTLKKLGVQDSKKLSSLKREYLYPKLLKLSAKCYTKKVLPKEIDSFGLTSLCLSAITELLLKVHKSSLRISCLYIDSLGALAKKLFCQYIHSEVFDKTGYSYDIVYEPKADDTYPVVSAASVIAKVTRDREIIKLHKVVGYDFGSGYPNKKTESFIASYFRETGALPYGTRRKWRNVQAIIQKP
ncbi:MAG: ribonuclease HII [Elusimicrobiota bacterium]